MSKMSMPGFTAQSVFPAANRHNLVIGAMLPIDTRYPKTGKSVPGPDLYGECVGKCIERGNERDYCEEDYCKPDRRYVKEPEESSWFNKMLCKGATWAWNKACIVDCSVLTGGEYALCKAGCDYVANQNDC